MPCHGCLGFAQEEKKRQGDQQQYPAQDIDLTKGDDIRLGDHLSIDNLIALAFAVDATVSRCGHRHSDRS